MTIVLSSPSHCIAWHVISSPDQTDYTWTRRWFWFSAMYRFVSSGVLPIFRIPLVLPVLPDWIHHSASYRVTKISHPQTAPRSPRQDCNGLVDLYLTRAYYYYPCTTLFLILSNGNLGGLIWEAKKWRTIQNKYTGLISFLAGLDFRLKWTDNTESFSLKVEVAGKINYHGVSRWSMIDFHSRLG